MSEKYNQNDEYNEAMGMFGAMFTHFVIGTMNEIMAMAGANGQMPGVNEGSDYQTDAIPHAEIPPYTCQLRDGRYYYISCMNEFVNGLYPESEFEDDDDAIRTASNYEATLYKYDIHNGERAETCVLYEPA